jgi:tellurite resistance protein TehA-like permease
MTSPNPREPPDGRTASKPSMRPFAQRLRAWLAGQIETLYPGSFAVVMATGIISNAFFLEGHPILSDALFAANLLAYSLLVIFMVLRLLWFGPALRADLINPRLVFSFFTIVAATDVLGTGIDLRGVESVAQALWFFALLAWFVLIYFSFAVLIFLNTRHGADILEGGWLMAIVGTQSLVILGATVGATLGHLRPGVFVLIHLLWGLGLALYGIYIAIFCYRIFFSDIRPDDVTPSLWVVMGAAAISTNAGSVLVLTDSGISFLQSMRPFIEGVTPLIWAWGTWWIPLLALLGIWKHVVCRVPLTYTPTLWSLVFPLGMYAEASLRLSLAEDFPPLRSVSEAMLWVALVAWAITASALAAASWFSFRDHARSSDFGWASSGER